MCRLLVHVRDSGDGHMGETGARAVVREEHLHDG